MSTRDPLVQEALGYRPLQEIIRARLRDAIVSGQYQPGDRLRIVAIAEKYGVSSMPIREALRTLEAEGLVEFSPNRGAVVRRLSPEDVKETFLIRISLECAALREAIEKLTDADFEQLQELLKKMDGAEDDSSAWTDLNQQFHLRMYGAAGLMRINQILTGLGGLIRPYLGVYLARAGSMRTARAQHAALLRAARRGDVDGAATVLEEHLVHTRDLVLGALEEADTERTTAAGRAETGRRR